MPEENTPSAPITTPNAPSFVPTDVMALSQQNAALTQQLKALTDERMDNEKTKELQTQLEALKADYETLKSQKEALDMEKTTSERKSALEGKVSNADMALKLIDSEKHVDAEGKIKLESLLADYPTLAPAGIAVSTAPAEPIIAAGGGRAISLDQALSSNDNSAINAAFDAELGGNK